MVSEVVESMVQLREEDLLQVDSRERENFWLNLAKAKEMGMEMAEVRKDLLEVLEEPGAVSEKRAGGRDMMTTPATRQVPISVL